MENSLSSDTNRNSKGQFKKGSNSSFKTQFKKGMVPWNKGKKLLQISGKNNPFYGKKHTIETRKKIVNALKKIKNPPWKKKRGSPSIETRKKMSEAKKGKPSPKKGIKTGIIPKSAFKKGVYTEAMRKGSLLGAKTLSERKITSIEKKLYDELKLKNIIFEKQKLINNKFLVDAYVPFLNLVIEADGDYWHNLNRVKKKDKAENAYLMKCGYNLLRLTETEINNGEFRKKINWQM